ncbi:hypothetical protein [Allobranchiibius sp. GilTou73]|uniref:hypothetical protein n=1 Tax=Allobranchiibius sp. GilTou73 TaxID=2904523 RepID=UPI001F20A8DD|nr:hypothetical protein [Allobranchiibius sp. GilTou73]UIJ33526.1 hypothetical protein LVQ62_10085 [Allobranchiibius sp. GilTou73]
MGTGISWIGAEPCRISHIAAVSAAGRIGRSTTGAAPTARATSVRHWFNDARRSAREACGAIPSSTDSKTASTRSGSGSAAGRLGQLPQPHRWAHHPPSRVTNRCAASTSWARSTS